MTTTKPSMEPDFFRNGQDVEACEKCRVDLDRHNSGSWVPALRGWARNCLTCFQLVEAVRGPQEKRDA